MPRSISPRTSVEGLKREAKRWLKALRVGDADALARLHAVWPDAPSSPTLRDAQRALALEHGLPGWASLIDRLSLTQAARSYERVADALVRAYAHGERADMRVVWDYFGHGRTWEAMRRYVRLDLGRTQDPQPGEVDAITIDDARYLVARAQGFEHWPALMEYAATVRADKDTPSKAVTVYIHDASGEQRPVERVRDWDAAIALLEERRLPGFHASGQMTDALLERLSRIEHLESLDLQGSRALGDDGIRYLARLPRLKFLNLMGTGVTDRGLDVLRRLPLLESISLSWTHTTDAGAQHLSACDALRVVDVSATACGDGAIRALAGKRQLIELRTGAEVTDAGLQALRDLPVFCTWHGGETRMGLTSPNARPNMLFLRGPFTDDGLKHLADLDGLYALNLDNDQLRITGAGLDHLRALPHLEWLAFDATDDSMAHIAALPHLRFLMCQDTNAGDDGFVALSGSRTLEHIWGRRCHNLRRRGFQALATMPALRYLSVSCKNVDDEGIASLPDFPALLELMPMDVPDEGYRHIGRCARLESLVLMYCRDTGDRATEHITGLSLKKYFASYNRITDRTPELLATMPTLESVIFDTCASVTSAGISALARLPNLTQLSVSGMPRVTRDVLSAFGPGVEVRYWT